MALTLILEVFLPAFVCKLAAPNACNASSVTGPIRAIRFYSQMKELQPQKGTW
jgi:hypothetical protein